MSRFTEARGDCLHSWLGTDQKVSVDRNLPRAIFSTIEIIDRILMKKKDFWTTLDVIKELELDRHYATVEGAQRRVQRLRSYATLVEGVDFIKPSQTSIIFTRSGFDKLRAEEKSRRKHYSPKGGKPFRKSR